MATNFRRRLGFFALIFMLFMACDNMTTNRVTPIDNQAGGFEFLETADLLLELKWDERKKYCEEKGDFLVETHVDSFLTKFIFQKKRNVRSVNIERYEIYSFNGLVLEFNKRIFNDSLERKVEYFDKGLWSKYIKSAMPDLSHEYIISTSESKETLKSYYELLGLNTADEYGWICEYSTIGMMTERRKALLNLVEDGRGDLLKKLINFPNNQTQLYAVDALLYLDHKIRAELEYIKESLKEGVPGISDEKINQSYLFTKRQEELLTEIEWKEIEILKSLDEEINTCGNMGSFKIYISTMSELLSDEMILRVIKQYEDHEILKIY
jgi:hypothetical protein